VSPPTHVAITGASSGIGAGLAVEYAGPGVRLALAGRDPERLEAVAAACRRAGAIVTTTRFDVRHGEAARAWVEAADHAHPIDVLAACAGVASGMSESGLPESPEAAAEVLATNVTGTLNVALPAARRMAARGRGHVALMSSLVALVPFVTAPSYSASKRAVLDLARGLRGALDPHGVKVTVVCSGYVDTPMTRSLTGSKPLCVPTTEAARRIRAGVDRGAARVMFPLPLVLLAHVGTYLPFPVTSFLARPFSYRMRDDPSQGAV
jgi:short-subunit dehydrogenase